MAIVLAVVLTAALVGALVVAASSRVTRLQLERALAAGERHDDLRADAFHHELTGMAGQLDRVTGIVADLRAERAGQHGELLARVAEATRVTEDLHAATAGLERMLASPQARGQWGERMCDDVLRAAGFEEGVTHRKQVQLADGTRPDVTFLLPDDRVLHMDVKFPLAGYQRWCAATTDRERAEAVHGFLRDVRARVRELSRPGYVDGASTVGFVLLFIPNESVYGFIHQHDPELGDEALRRRVVLCSPFTLFAVLGVIRQAADALAVARGADEVLEVLGGFTKQWDQFTERLDLLGKHLQTATNTYEQVNGPRRRQLERQLDRVADVRRGRGIGADASTDDDTAAGGEASVLREAVPW
jgi:DNA recombination protein RmuC